MSFLNKYPSCVERPCDVCSGDDFELLTWLRSPRIPDYAAPISICRTCGFVTTRPRPNSEDYKAINDRWYPFKFSIDPPSDPDEAKKFKKWRPMWNRVAPHFPEGPRRLLDVGAGQGWAIEYLKLQRPALDAVAIEQWEPSQRYLRANLGVEVVDVDINQEWPTSLHNRFDFIILRHTLEHLEHPLATLKQLSRCLTHDGYVYIAVPSARAAKSGHPIRTDFFRPIHLHYFNEITLVRIAAKAGLVPHVLEAPGEIWGLFRHRREGEELPSACTQNSFEQQREFLVDRLRQARWVDMKRAALSGALALLKRLPQPAVTNDD